MIMKPKFVEKSWGWEKWFDNNNLYCGKILKVLQDKWSSKGRYHYHKKKMETFIVIEGELLLEIGDENGRIFPYVLTPYESVRVKPGTKHRFTSNTEHAKFIEVSTTHSDSDSFRCVWDHTERKWIDV